MKVDRKILDWDEYFERRQEIRFVWWKKYFNKLIISARDREFAKSQYQSWFLDSIDECWPNGRIKVTKDKQGSIDDPVENLEYFYYMDVYSKFLTVWKLNDQRPIAIFLRDNFPNLFDQYKSRLLDTVGKVDVGYTDTNRSAYSYESQKDIVEWLASLLARNRVITYLKELEPDQLAPEVVIPKTSAIMQSDGIGTTKRSRTPKKEDTQTEYKLISAKIKSRLKNGMSKSKAIKEVAADMNKTERVVYNALRAYPPNF